jgi:hypothetical protein
VRWVEVLYLLGVVGLDMAENLNEIAVSKLHEERT